MTDLPAVVWPRRLRRYSGKYLFIKINKETVAESQLSLTRKKESRNLLTTKQK